MMKSLREFKALIETQMTDAIQDNAFVLARALSETLSSQAALPDMYLIRSDRDWKKNEKRCAAALERVRRNISRIMAEADDFICEISHHLPAPPKSVLRKPSKKKSNKRASTP